METRTPDYAAEMYDMWYEAVGKNYESEAQSLVTRARELVPESTSLLDVACGTGMHAQHFVDAGLAVTGLDLHPGFIDIASERVPGANFKVADMRSFDLRRKFDIVACCFSAIGHVQNLDELDAAIASMARHVAPGGVLFVEPWFSSAQWKTGSPHVLTVQKDGFVATRANISGREGNSAIIHFICSAADIEKVWSWEERHELLLIEPERYALAFERAGMTGTFEEDVLPRGTWVGRH